MNCGSCEEVITFPNEVFTCSVCQVLYHPACVNCREEKFRNLSSSKKSSWKCSKCIINPSTSQQNSKAQDTPTPSDSDSSMVPASIEKCMNAINEKLESLQAENRELKSYLTTRLGDVIQSIDYNSNMIKELSTKNEKLEKEVNSLNLCLKSAMAENATLKSKVEDLTAEIVDLQQYSRRSNLEICEVPETLNENVEELTETILKALNVRDSCEILAAHRVPTRNASRTKPIIVQLQSKIAKEKCIKAARSAKLQAKDCNSEFPITPIFINEHLCPALKNIYFEARKFKRKFNYKYCWVRDSKIYLRLNEESKAIRINTLSDIPND